MTDRRRVSFLTAKNSKWLALGLLYPSFCAHAVEVGSMSGQLLQNNPALTTPPPPSEKKSEKVSLSREVHTEKEDDGPTIPVAGIVVEGVPESAQADVKQLTEKFKNRRMTFIALKNVGVNITALLQKHGESLSYAYIPEQKITDGIVKFSIMRGHVEAIKIQKNQSLVDDNVVNRYIAQMYALKAKISLLESSLSRVSDLPGVGDLSSYLSAGKEQGGSVISLDLTPSPRVDGAVVFDNKGSLSSGRSRLGLQLNVNSPLGWGDRLQVLAYAAPDFLQTTNDSKHGNTLIGRLGYDAPVGTRGWRLGTAVSRVSYRLGGPVLHGLGDGYADVASLYSTWAMLRGDGSNLDLSATLDYKRMQDKFWGMKNIRHAPVFTLQLSGDTRGAFWGRPNVVQYQLSPAAGRLSNTRDWNGNNTKGSFFKLTENATFIQAVYPGISLSIGFNGQQSSKNLDGAEQMSLGGPYAVRAYSNASASVDSGWVASPAVNLTLPKIEDASLQLFYDYGRGKIQKFAPSSQKIVMKGYGVGLNYKFNSWFFINASYAWRQGRDKHLGSQNKATGYITTGINF